MKKLVVFLIVLAFNAGLLGQNGFYEKVGSKQLPLPAKSIFNNPNNPNTLYATSQNNDSFYVHSLDLTTNNWVFVGSGNLTFHSYPDYRDVKGFFLKDSLYVVVGNSFNNKVNILSLGSNGAFYSVSLFNFASGGGSINVHQHDSIVYLTGFFDSFSSGGGWTKIGVLTFDGTKVQPSNFQGKNVTCSYSRNDTIFLVAQGTIYLFKTSLAEDSGRLYYYVNEEIEAIYGDGGGIIIVTNWRIVRILNGTRIGWIYFDIEAIPNHFAGSTYKSIITVNGQTLMYNYGTCYLVDKLKGQLKGIKPFTGVPINYKTELVRLNNEIYLVPQKTVVLSNDSFNVIRLNLDSMQHFGYDSLYVQIFKDEDRDGKFSDGDSSISGNLFFHPVNPSIRDYIGVQTGKGFKKILIPDDKDYLFEYEVNYPDENYFLPFSGFRFTNNLVPGKTRDTLIFPFIKRGELKDPQVRFVTSNRARLNDPITNLATVFDEWYVKSPYSVNLFIVLPEKAEFLNSYPNFNNKSGDTLFYSISNLQKGNPQFIELQLQYDNVNFKIGDKVQLKVYILDSSSINIINKDSITTTMVYSYDPNEKVAQPSGFISKDIDKIKYTIHFQNEGNDVARRVIIKDTIDKGLSVLWFRMINASHPYVVTIQNNVITWIFDNINLSSKSKDDKASQGYVSFEVKVNGKMAIGDSLINNAYIYFDENPPVITNYASVKRIIEVRENEELLRANGASLLVYPNPTENKIFLKNISNIPLSVVIYNVLGCKITTLIIDKQSVLTYDLPQLEAGIYLLNVKETGVSLKLMVE